MKQTGKPRKNELKHRHNPNTTDQGKYSSDEKNLYNKTQTILGSFYNARMERQTLYINNILCTICLSFIHYM